VDALRHPSRRDIEPACSLGDRTIVDHHYEAFEEATVHDNKIYLLK